MKIHAIQTGTVAITTKWREGVGHGRLRLVNTQDTLLRGVVDGVGPDEIAERLTHDRIRVYAAQTPTVYLPTHDPETGARLSARRTIAAAREEAIT